jgi:hypothetical protein
MKRLSLVLVIAASLAAPAAAETLIPFTRHTRARRRASRWWSS